MSKHSVGPWSVMGQGQDEIWSPDSHTEGCYEQIATITDGGDRMMEKANARLIAAAPELLEALQKCEYTLTNMVGMSDLCAKELQKSIDKARAAIKKATGEEA